MKYKILEFLQKSDEYISGAELSRKLGISRSAVWKNINALKKDGFGIVAVSGKGYKITFAPDRINPEALKKCIPGEVYYFASTTSTNFEAKRAENVKNGSVFIAEVQTGGRGRLGRSWSSSKGCGIWMSICLEPNIVAADVSLLTLVAGLAVCRTIKGSAIKWPNDVLINGKKICGILTEMTAEIDRAAKVVIGIGVNVNNEFFNIDLIDKATSLYLETRKKHSREELACRILKEFFELYEVFLRDGFSEMAREYKMHCITLERDVLIIKNGEEIAARAVDLTENGELVVEYGGKRQVVNSGEVSVRGLLGYN